MGRSQSSLKVTSSAFTYGQLWFMIWHEYCIIIVSRDKLRSKILKSRVHLNRTPKVCSLNFTKINITKNHHTNTQIHSHACVYDTIWHSSESYDTPKKAFLASVTTLFFFFPGVEVNVNVRILHLHTVYV